jgi:hypothetical protein
MNTPAINKTMLSENAHISPYEVLGLKAIELYPGRVHHDQRVCHKYVSGVQEKSFVRLNDQLAHANLRMRTQPATAKYEKDRPGHPTKIVR